MSTLNDFQFAIRILMRNPGFSLATVLTFALGIGAAIAIFSVVNAVLMRPLPYRNPTQLVAVWERNPTATAKNVVSVDNFEALQLHTQSFTGLAALVPAPVTVLGDGNVERVTGVQTSPGYFNLLGVAPALGREFDASDAEDNAVILSHAYATRRFGDATRALGQNLIVNDKPMTVIGVMPADFDPPRYGWIDEQELWLQFLATAQNRAWGHVLHVIGRLRPDRSIENADAELSGFARQLAEENPAQNGWSMSANALSEEITGDARAPLLLLLGGVVLLLLMSITNVANLTIGLTRRRNHEFSVRHAIGATRKRVVQQLFVQGALLSALGLMVGLAVARVGVSVLTALMPAGIPRTSDIGLDAPVLIAALTTATLATVVFGLGAAFRNEPNRSTATDLAGSTAQRASTRLGAGMLITAEIAIALVLSVLAALMLRSFANLRNVDRGFDSDQVTAGRIALSGERYATADQQRQFFDQLLQRLRNTPGVELVSMINVRPFRAGTTATSISDPAQAPGAGERPPVTDIRYAETALFNTLHIPFIRGGSFTLAQGADMPPQVVINQAAARALNLPDNPIGRQIDIQLNGGFRAEIVGVVGDVRLVGPRTLARPTAYLSSTQNPNPVNDILLRGTVGAQTLAAALRSASVATDPMVPVYDTEPLQDLVDRSLARDRFTTFLLGVFSLSSLLLAGVGIYGVFSADVASRRGEIGIRRALGAGALNILRVVLRRSLGRAALGIAVGIVVAVAASRAISTLLFDVGSTDLGSFALVVAVLIATALVGALLPAWRALHVSPVVAIRNE